jgi:hypothetical protein
MFTTLLLPLVLLATDDPSGSKERQRHPLAPSLPLLTKEEDARFDAIIERFIEADTGKITGLAGKKAMAEMERLGPEAIFNLIEGFNRAANMEASCPAVLLGKKISRILGGSKDVELLAFAKENIGAGVTAKRHLGVVKDLQVGCMLRKTAVLREQALAARAGPNLMPGGWKMPATMSMPELSKAAEKAKGPQLKQLLTEAEKRKGPEVLTLLAAAGADRDAEIQKLSKDLLVKHLQRQPADKLKEMLKHDRAEVRAGAARVVGDKQLRYGAELIELLRDVEPAVQQAARQALVRLARGADYGPAADADSGAREEAVTRWQQWWKTQTKR